jgi:hypothetical protein
MGDILRMKKRQAFCVLEFAESLTTLLLSIQDFLSKCPSSHL